jgi:hypothetical protein
MAKKPTFGKKLEAMIVLGCALWLVIGIASDVLNFIIHQWHLTVPLSILLIWWYCFRDGKHQ